MKVSAVGEVLHLHQIRPFGDSVEGEFSFRPCQGLKADRTDAGSIQPKEFDLRARDRLARSSVDDPAGDAVADLGVRGNDAQTEDDEERHCGRSPAPHLHLWHRRPLLFNLSRTRNPSEGA